VALYRILQSTDWSFLVGTEVIQIAIGFHQVQIALFKDKATPGLNISIESEFEHRRSDEVMSNAADMPTQATTLVSLLGKLIESVHAEGDEALVIRFGEDETLTILAKDSPYESFQINGPQGLIVV
jgi:hypothetical protein